MATAEERNEFLNAAPAILAMLSAAAAITSFSSASWHTHQVLYEFRRRAEGTSLEDRVQGWRFSATPGAGFIPHGYHRLLWTLVAEGWLETAEWPEPGYRISSGFVEWGRTLLAELPAGERRVVRQVARRWTTWSNAWAKNSS